MKKTKKVKRWIGFFYGVDGRLVVQGSDMYPALYKTKKEAFEKTSNDTLYEVEVVSIMVNSDAKGVI